MFGIIIIASLEMKTFKEYLLEKKKRKTKKRKKNIRSKKVHGGFWWGAGYPYFDGTGDGDGGGEG